MVFPEMTGRNSVQVLVRLRIDCPTRASCAAKRRCTYNLLWAPTLRTFDCGLSQSLRGAGRARRDDAGMALDLTDLELETATRACRSWPGR
jgi:hypothetical protein